MLLKYIKYAINNVMGMLVMTLDVIVDTYFISVFAGTKGLAVLSLVIPLYTIIYALGSLVGTGSAIRFKLRRSVRGNTDTYFTQSILWTLILWIPLLIIGIAMPRNLLGLLGGDVALRAFGENNVRIILLGAPILMCSYTFTDFAKVDRDVKLVNIAEICGSFAKIILDYVLIFKTPLGFCGAAVASILSHIVIILVSSIHYFKPKNHVNFQFGPLSIMHFMQCISCDFMTFLGEVLTAGIGILFNIMIHHLAGNPGIAAYGIITNLALLVEVVFEGISHAVQQIIHENFGKRDKKTERKFLRYGIVTTALVETLTIILVWVKTDTLISTFNGGNNDLLYHYAFTGLRLYALGFILAGINVVLISYYSATSNEIQAMVGAVMRSVVAIVGCAIVLTTFLGMNGKWLCFIAAEAVTLLVMAVMRHWRKQWIEREKIE
ncbi:MAG: MATE family efflux transporter [Lachnospiraceae bacterium]|nr:MATE family efflux transporter [Lachnospiraceae bacterium]